MSDKFQKGQRVVLLDRAKNVKLDCVVTKTTRDRFYINLPPGHPMAASDHPTFLKKNGEPTRKEFRGLFSVHLPNNLVPSAPAATTSLPSPISNSTPLIDGVDAPVTAIYQELIQSGVVPRLQEYVPGVPVYILEELLYQLGNSDDVFSEQSVASVCDRLRMLVAHNSVQAVEQLKQTGTITLFDRVKFRMMEKQIWGDLSFAGDNLHVAPELQEVTGEMLDQSTWSFVRLAYRPEDDPKRPVWIVGIQPLVPQAKTDFEAFCKFRNKWSANQWLDMLVCTLGFDATELTMRVKLLIVARLIPFVEKNFNFLELGPRGTGKSWSYSNLSPFATIVMGGLTTPSQLLYDLTTDKYGLVCLHDAVVLDEITSLHSERREFVDSLKGYMESGSLPLRDFGKPSHADASIVLLGNPPSQAKPGDDHFASNLPLPLQDPAFLDRLHFFLPGWEIPRVTYGSASSRMVLSSVYFSMAMHGLREVAWEDVLRGQFEFGLNGFGFGHRDRRAVVKTVSGFVKLLNPSGDVGPDQLALYLETALEGRRRVREQMKSIGGEEHQELAFNYRRTGSDGIVDVQIREHQPTDNSSSIKLIPPEKQLSSEAESAFSSQLVVTRFPAPIAIPYRRFCGQQESAGRLQALFHTFESSVRYLWVLSLSDLLSQWSHLPEKVERLMTHEKLYFLRSKRSITLGEWVHALKVIVRFLQETESRFFDQLVEVCGECGGVEEGIIGELIKLRNSAIHRDGSVTATAEQARAIENEFRPMLERFLSSIDFVCRYELAGIEPMPDISNGAFLRVHSFMGAPFAGLTSARELRAWQGCSLSSEMPFVIKPDDSSLLSLWPFLLTRHSNLTGRASLYLFERLTRSGDFLGEVSSYSVEVGGSDPWDYRAAAGRQTDFIWLMDKLTALPSRMKLPRDLQLGRQLRETRLPKHSGRDFAGLRLTRRLASGGFGSIYMARDSSGKEVVVKILEQATSGDTLRRFGEEYRKLKQFEDDPGIVRTYEFGMEEIEGRVTPWYSMEFAVGGDLSGRLEEQRILLTGKQQTAWNHPELRSQICADFREVCGIVARLHAKGLIHRDLKPGNVLIGEAGQLKIGDFGLVKALEPSVRTMQLAPQTSTGAVLGTQAYMSPEQSQGGDVAATSDVYSLGILLAEMACGQRPPMQILQKQEGSPLNNWRPLKSLPKALLKLLMRATNVDPAKRPSNAGDFLAQFDQIMSDVT